MKHFDALTMGSMQEACKEYSAVLSSPNDLLTVGTSEALHVGLLIYSASEAP